jgi:hypothetical protein
MTARTLGEIARAYDEKRNRILAAIETGEVSASMSGIEYYPKPWVDLDMNDPFDVSLISSALTWNGFEHDYTGLRKLTPDELSIKREISDLYRQPAGPERETRIAEARARLADASHSGGEG